MKKIYFVLFTLALFAVKEVSACSMPLPAFQQKGQLELALSSAAYQNALNKMVHADTFVRIENISFDKGINVELSNGCTINVTLKYKAPEHLGMCPKFDGA